MPIADIKRRDVIALMDKASKRGKPSTTRHLFANLRKMFNWAAERDLIETSPCANMKNPGSFNTRDRVLTDAEIRAIWQECDFIGAPYGKIVQFLLLTGQRLGEVAKMKWGEVDFAEAVWRLPRERTKSSRAHDVPLSSAAIALLQSLPRYVSEGGAAPDAIQHFTDFNFLTQLPAFMAGFAAFYAWRAAPPIASARWHPYAVLAVILYCAVAPADAWRNALLADGLWILLLSTVARQECAIFMRGILPYLGQCSYSIYLLHFAVLAAIQQAPLQELISLPLPPLVALTCLYAATLASSTVIARVTWRKIEQPMIAWGRRIAARYA